MDTTTYALVAAVVVLALLVGLVARSRRDRSLQPVRLGPSWAPPGAGGRGGAVIGAVEVLGDDDRIGSLRERTGLDEETVATVLLAWDELASVLGHGPLAADHRYRVYDPYDPPVTARGADGRPVVDPARVARDVDTRTSVAEVDARTVLTALHEDGLDGDLDVDDADTAADTTGTGDGEPSGPPATPAGSRGGAPGGSGPVAAPGDPGSHVRLAPRPDGGERPATGVGDLDAADDDLFGGPAAPDDRDQRS